MCSPLAPCCIKRLRHWVIFLCFALQFVCTCDKAGGGFRVSQQVGRTEKIQNCLNPKFAKKFLVDYYFEMVQKLKFGIYDIDNKTIDLSDDDFLGELECTLGQVRGSLASWKAFLLLFPAIFSALQRKKEQQHTSVLQKDQMPPITACCTVSRCVI